MTKMIDPKTQTLIDLHHARRSLREMGQGIMPSHEDATKAVATLKALMDSPDCEETQRRALLTPMRVLSYIKVGAAPAPHFCEEADKRLEKFISEWTARQDQQAVQAAKASQTPQSAQRLIDLEYARRAVILMSRGIMPSFEDAKKAGDTLREVSQDDVTQRQALRTPTRVLDCIKVGVMPAPHFCVEADKQLEKFIDAFSRQALQQPQSDQAVTELAGDFSEDGEEVRRADRMRGWVAVHAEGDPKGPEVPSAIADSMMHRLLDLKGSLPAVRRDIFEFVYQQGMPREACASRLGLTLDQFEVEHTQMLRSLRIGASSA